MRVLCVSAPLPGHLDWGGYLLTARELQARGHTLLWASGAAVRSAVEEAGVPFHTVSETGWRWPPPPPLTADAAGDPQSYQRLRQLRSLDQWLDVARVSTAVEELGLLVNEFQPHLILAEMFMAAAGIVSEAAAIPLVVVGWPAPGSRRLDSAGPPAGSTLDPMVLTGRQRLEELLARSNIAGDNWTATGPPALAAPALHLSYWSAGWFQGMALGPQTRHVGGVAPPPRRLSRTYSDPTAAPWVFITLGTTFNQDANFFAAAGQAAAQIGAIPIIALGADLDGHDGRQLVQSLHGRLPTTALVSATVDFAAALPHCAAAIHHGGAGTTHALVTQGVPQIVAPHAADQARQAQGVARTGCGYHLAPQQATVQNLTNALAQLLPDEAPARTNARTLQAEFAALGGIARAADLVEQVGLR